MKKSLLIALVIALISFFGFVSKSLAESAWGVLGELHVDKRGWHVKFDNHMDSCGSNGMFVLSQQNLNDLAMLSDAVMSGRPVYFQYQCRGDGIHQVYSWEWRR